MELSDSEGCLDIDQFEEQRKISLKLNRISKNLARSIKNKKVKQYTKKMKNPFNSNSTSNFQIIS